jgi:hypothetical protein
MILRLAVTEARSALEVDEIGLGRGRLVLREDGNLVLGYPASEQSDGSGSWAGIVERNLEEELGNVELAWEDAALTAEQLGWRNW